MHAIKKLMFEYKQTAQMLYDKLQRMHPDNACYPVVLSEYQHACEVRRQLESYCRVWGLL